MMLKFSLRLHFDSRICYDSSFLIDSCSSLFLLIASSLHSWPLNLTNLISTHYLLSMQVDISKNYCSSLLDCLTD